MKVSCWDQLRTLKLESGMSVSGKIVSKYGSIEIRKLDREVLASSSTDKALSSLHLYLRNPLIQELNLYRSTFFLAIHQWFDNHKFVDFSPPFITPPILYEPNSAIHITNMKSNKALFLSQYTKFYLEATAHIREHIYNLGPSFRNESRTNCYTR